MLNQVQIKYMKPILSNINQILSIENMDEIKKNNKTFTHYNFGNDRIVTLKHNDTSIKTQWNGTCTSFAVIAAIENKLGGKLDLSERSLWDFYGVYNTEQAIKTAEIHYILEEQFWPQHQQTLDPNSKLKGRYIISKYKKLLNNVDEVILAINNFNPCIVGLSTPVDLIRGKIQIEATSKLKKNSGHAMCVVGYKIENNKFYFIVKNSWGQKNGDNGYQMIDFKLYENQGYIYFWEIQDIYDRGEQLF